MSTAFIDKEVHIMGRHRLSPTSSARIEAHAQRGADFHMVTVDRPKCAVEKMVVKSVPGGENSYKGP